MGHVRARQLATRSCQHESNGPRSRRAFEVLICQANGPNVVNVRAKIKRPSAIGSTIVTGPSFEAGKRPEESELVFALRRLRHYSGRGLETRRLSPFTMPANLITTLERSIPQCLLRSLSHPLPLAVSLNHTPSRRGLLPLCCRPSRVEAGNKSVKSNTVLCCKTSAS